MSPVAARRGRRPDLRKVRGGQVSAMVARMASATAAAPAAGPTAEDDEGRLERAYLGGGWAMDGWEPTEEELEYRQEHARQAQAAKPLWLQLLTAVSRLPAPDRDVLRGLLTTTLRVDVPAALLRMPEDSFCEVLLGAVAQLVEDLAAVDATGPVTAILTPPPDQLEQPLPAAQSRGEVT